MPSRDDYIAAFDSVGLSRVDRRILSALINTATQDIDHAEVARQAGVHLNVLSSRLGALGHRVSDELGISHELPIRPSDQRPIWSSALGTWDKASHRWRLFPEVIGALSLFGLPEDDPA